MGLTNFRTSAYAIRCMIFSLAVEIIWFLGVSLPVFSFDIFIINRFVRGSMAARYDEHLHKVFLMTFAAREDASVRKFKRDRRDVTHLS